MNVVYTLEDLPETLTKSLFLAGPSTRDGTTEWRLDALKILEDIGFDGTVFVPEPPPNKEWHNDLHAQIVWEDKCISLCDALVFWVPREMKSMPGLTTNIEFGRNESRPNLVLGYPEDAEKMKYIQYYADQLNIPTFHSLTETLQCALDKVGEGAERIGIEREIPLHIWKLDTFQTWYQNQVKLGNSLQKAKVLYTFRPDSKDFVFLWVLHAEVYVASEDRVKKNEFVLSRTDTSSVLLYCKKEPIQNSEIILIKEFRTPAVTTDGLVLELPGGSASPKEKLDPLETAAQEVLEETGFNLDAKRLKKHAARQPVATLSAHRSHFYSAELNDEEMEWFKSQKGITHSNEEDSEKTYIEVLSFKDLLNTDIDWANLGQIFSCLCGINDED